MKATTVDGARARERERGREGEREREGKASTEKRLAPRPSNDYPG